MSNSAENKQIHHYTFGNMWTEESWARYQKKKAALAKKANKKSSKTRKRKK